MKILIISDAWIPQVNGVVRTYQGLMPTLRALGHEVDIIGPDHFKRCLPAPGYNEIKLSIAPYRALAKMIKTHQADSIHIATEGPLGWAARRYCLNHSIKFTTCYHSKFPEFIEVRVRKIFPLLSKWVHRKTVNMLRKFHAPSSAMMVTTPSLAEELKHQNFNAPLHILTRGVDIDIFKPAQASILKDLQRPVALYVGRLAIEKNIEEFLNMEWMGSKVVVGHGPDEGVLKACYPDTIFKGKKEGADLAAYYQSADVFVFPSYTDTFGIVLIEALACGLPIAAHNVTGPRDVITNETLGALDDNLSNAASNALKNGVSADCRHHVMAHYSWEQAAKQFITAQSTTLK